MRLVLMVEILLNVIAVGYLSMKVMFLTNAHILVSHDLHVTGCYGVPEEDGVDDSRSDLSSFTTIPWFCDACKAGVDPSTCVSLTIPTHNFNIRLCY